MGIKQPSPDTFARCPCNNNVLNTRVGTTLLHERHEKLKKIQKGKWNILA